MHSEYKRIVLYVCRRKKKLKYILTHKLSQDHLELFFGAIRGKGGFNNNPTARQFEAAYKRLLVHTEITGPNTGNTLNLDNITILTCGSSQQLTIDDNGEDILQSKEYLSFERSVKDNIEKNDCLTSSAWDLTIYTEDIVAYIAGFVIKSINRCVTCLKCREVLETSETISSLQKRKQFGNLIKASRPVIEICQIAEKYFRFFDKTIGIFNKNVKNLIDTLTKKAFQMVTPKILHHFNQHLLETDFLDGHVILLIKLILKKYFNLRVYHETVKRSDYLKRNKIRSIFTKTILFRHE